MREERSELLSKYVIAQGKAGLCPATKRGNRKVTLPKIPTIYGRKKRPKNGAATRRGGGGQPQ